MGQPSLEQRAARCVEHVNATGLPCALVVADELERLIAQRLIGQAPVIVCTGSQLMEFLSVWPRAEVRSRERTVRRRSR